MPTSIFAIRMIVIFRWLALLALLFWLLVYWQGGFKILTDIRSALKNKVSRLDAFLLVVLAVLGLGMTVTAIIVTLGWVNVPVSAWLAWLGCLLTLAGVGGTFYCRSFLGKFWTAETALQGKHTIVDAGPYSVVRHPVYTFAILLYLGLGLVFPAWGNLLSAAGIAVAYVFKARDEETFLASHLDSYAAYQKRVRYRLFLGIW